MDEEVNPRLLVLAREFRGLTQKQLVEKINIDQGNYSKMEKGLLNVPEETLIKISNQLKFNKSFFLKADNTSPISSFYYRKRIGLPKKELSLLESKLDIFRLLIDDLLDAVDIPEFKIPQYEVTDQLSAGDIAVRLRDFLKLPRGPIKNLVSTLEAAGIIIYFIKGVSAKFDGITLFTNSGQPILFVNSAMPNERKMFTIAHELFHLIAHIPYSPLSQDRNPEKEANEFAGEFLMPFLDCRNDLMDLRYSQLGVLKSYWKISKAAIIYRAKDAYAISSDRFTNLNIELSRNGEKKKETGFVDISEPQLVHLIISTHENALDYSLDDLLNMLGIDSETYFDYFENSKYKTNLVTPKRVIELSSRPRQNEKRALDPFN